MSISTPPANDAAGNEVGASTQPNSLDREPAAVALAIVSTKDEAYFTASACDYSTAWF